MPCPYDDLLVHLTNGFYCQFCKTLIIPTQPAGHRTSEAEHTTPAVPAYMFTYHGSAYTVHDDGTQRTIYAGTQRIGSVVRRYDAFPGDRPWEMLCTANGTPIAASQSKDNMSAVMRFDARPYQKYQDPVIYLIDEHEYSLRKKP
jgi:hypothetical protein